MSCKHIIVYLKLNFSSEFCLKSLHTILYSIPQHTLSCLFSKTSSSIWTQNSRRELDRKLPNLSPAYLLSFGLVWTYPGIQGIVIMYKMDAMAGMDSLEAR